MSNYAFTHKSGEMLEVRALSETHVSGNMQSGRGTISSRTTHFNRCRIRWDGGGEEFVDCGGSYSIGDRASIIYENGRKISDLNLNTREYQKLSNTIGCVGFLVLLVSIGLIFLFGIGIITTAALVWWWMDKNKKRNAAFAEYVAQIR